MAKETEKAADMKPFAHVGFNKVLIRPLDEEQSRGGIIIPAAHMGKDVKLGQLLRVGLVDEDRKVYAEFLREQAEGLRVWYYWHNALSVLSRGKAYDVVRIDDVLTVNWE